MDPRKAETTGRMGEMLAREWLEEQGFLVIETNWRVGRAEVDLIVKEKDMLVFVEVKTRSSIAFGEPESFLSAGQQKRLIQAAAAYMQANEYEGEVRFDIISIYWPLQGKPVLKHLEDAFFPGLA